MKDRRVAGLPVERARGEAEEPVEVDPAEVGAQPAEPVQPVGLGDVGVEGGIDDVKPHPDGPRRCSAVAAGGGMAVLVEQRRADEDGDQGLRSALWRANRFGPLLAGSLQSLRLGAHVVVAELAAAAAQMRATGIADAPFLASFHLELLPGWQDEWVTLERERLRQLELHVLDFLVAERVERATWARPSTPRSARSGSSR